MFLNQMSFFPSTFYHIFRRFILSYTMFYTIQPLTFIIISIKITHNPLTRLLIVLIITSICIAVRPYILPLTLFHIILPQPNKIFAIIQFHQRFTMKLIIDEITLKDAAFLHEDSSSMLFVIQEFTIIFGLNIILSLASSVWQIILPLPLISISTNIIHISTISIQNIILYVAFIKASFPLYISAFAITKAICKISLQIISIIQLQAAIAVWNIVYTLPVISSSNLTQVYFMKPLTFTFSIIELKGRYLLQLIFD